MYIINGSGGQLGGTAGGQKTNYCNTTVNRTICLKYLIGIEHSLTDQVTIVKTDNHKLKCHLKNKILQVSLETQYKTRNYDLKNMTSCLKVQFNELI